MVFSSKTKKPRTTNAFLSAAAEIVWFYDIPNPYRKDFHVLAINKFIADLKISYLHYKIAPTFQGLVTFHDLKLRYWNWKPIVNNK